MRVLQVGLILTAATALAQAPDRPTLVVPVGVEIVQVDAVVTDKDGRYVTDLTAEDFAIVEDGKTRAIANFRYVESVPAGTLAAASSSVPASAPESAPASTPPPEPRALAIVIDDLSLDFESLRRVRDMLTRYVDERLAPGERVSILLTSGGQSNLQQFTDDKRHLKAAIGGVTFNPLRRGAHAQPAAQQTLPGDEAVGSASDPAGAAVAAMQTRLEDLSVRMERERIAALGGGSLTLLTAVVQSLGRLPGRKALMLVSEGIPLSVPMRGSFAVSRPGGDGLEGEGRLRDITEAANRASVVFYTLDPSGLRTYGATAAGGASTSTDSTWVLRSSVEGERMRSMASRRLAIDTGGLALEGTNDLDRLVDRVFEDQGGYYLIGFEPVEGSARRKELHRVEVKAKRPGLQVRSRRTAYARPPAEPPAEDKRLITTLVSPFGAGDVPVRLTALFHHDPEKGGVVRALLHVDARALTFRPEADGTVSASVEAAALCIGARGALAGQAGGTYTVRLGAKAAEAARADGVVLTLDAAVPPGGCQVRAGARDVASGRAGSASQFVEVPDVGKGRFALSGIVMSGTDSAADAEPAPRSTPAVRKFSAGERVAYAFGVYNAARQRKPGAPGLDVQVGLMRDGVTLASLPGPVISTAPATGPVPVAGALRLTPRLEPGTYTLVVLVRDPVLKRNEQDAIQQIDFEILEPSGS
jgi:VWFA-related protein